MKHARKAAVRGLVVVASLSVLATPTVVGPTADALAVAAPCAAGTPAPKSPFAHDTVTASTAVKEQVASVVGTRSTDARARSSAAPLPASIVVPVRIHIIRGTHRKDRKVTRDGARRMFSVLRGGFAGQQDPTMTPTGITFDLRGITVTRNERWFHATPGSRADKQMKRTLHQGKLRTLNIYLNSVDVVGGSLLGIARFPWNAARYPKLDGVTINVASLAGGAARGYNLGDTVIHETGHWFGLFHTFEGGCEDPGDYVEDTAPEAKPSFQCELTRDTCETPLPEGWIAGDPPPEPVLDPIHNFMDYSYDTCMNHFTPDQRTRAVSLFMHYRYGR